jgi:type I restriction enzyme S subunit
MPTVDGDGAYMVTAKDIKNGRIQYQTARKTSWDAYRNKLTDKSRPSKGDLLLTKDGSIGRLALCDRDDICINQSVALLQSNGKADFRYIKYLLEAPEYQRKMESDSDGSTIKHIYITRVDKMVIPLPPRKEQKGIVAILGTLDDKIELNRKTNETLEAMAKALFKSWFVDFDPVRAKVEGRPTGLPDEISDLFPDSFEDSELGVIPSGWKYTPIFDLADYVNGASHSSEYLNHEKRGLPIIKIAELKNGITDQTKHWDSEYKQKHVIVEGDILFSWSGNPDTSIGTFVWGKERGLLNQHIFKVVPRQQAQRSFLLLLLKHNQTFFADIARDKQTTGLGHVTVKDLKESVCSFPCEPLMNAFARIVDSFINQFQTLTLQSDSFQNIRDTLLPKLISGEIRIPDAEKMLEEVGV